MFGISTFLTICLLGVSYGKLDTSWMDSWHAKVDSAGVCQSRLTLFLTDVSDIDDVYSCDAEPSGLSEEQEQWLEELGQQIRPGSKKLSSLTPVVRKDVRQYTKDEWNDITTAIRSMKTTYIGDITEYNVFVKLHQHDVGPAGTRAGPGSWGWHREYLARFEKAMQNHVPGVSLPFWDITLDVYIPTFQDSVLWSDDLFGNCGCDQKESYCRSERESIMVLVDVGSISEDVVTGPFANWTLDEPCGSSIRDETDVHYSYPYTSRGCAVTPNDQFYGTTQSFSDGELQYVLNLTSFADFSYDMCLLHDHDNLHWAVAGTSQFVFDKSCAVADPIMWFMHAYLDYVWELFRQKSQTTDHATDYKSDEEVMECHAFGADMTPFRNLLNSDGLDKLYTDYHYTYQESPSMCSTQDDCGSSYLWCDTYKSRCKSKIQNEKSCESQPDEACESGYCDHALIQGSDMYVCKDKSTSSSSGYGAMNSGFGGGSASKSKTSGMSSQNMESGGSKFSGSGGTSSVGEGIGGSSNSGSQAIGGFGGVRKI